MFRIAGLNLAIDHLLAAVRLPASMSFRKGEPRFRTRPRGKKNKKSGAAFLVSPADFDDFGKQKKDAIAFLKAKRKTIRRIMKWPGVDSGELDFGIGQREVVFQCEHLPAELLSLAGGLGLDIEISLYPPFAEKRKRKKSTTKSTVRLRCP